ncbi:MAG: GAF domain-containing protein [Bacteroidetes bacterium]|nr:GAF domain-containing protein [Bacteroidota bacterium]
MSKVPRTKTKSLETELNTLKTLSDIGREITSTLDLEKILFTVYKKVNKLMDATIFGIGLYQPEKKLIEYKLAIAESKKYKPYTKDTKNKNQFPVWCIENKTHIFINDLNKEYKKYFNKNPLLRRELEDGSMEKVVQSLLYLPIIVKKKVIGIITVQSYKKNVYSTYHLNVLQNIASYAGMAIENAQHFHSIEAKVTERTADIIRQQKEIENSYQNTKLLSDIGREIAASLSVKEIVEKAYNSVNKLMDATSFGIAIFNKEKKRLNFIYYIESGEPLPFHYADIEKDNRPATWCFNQQKEVFINDYLKEYKKYKLNKPKGAVVGEFTHSLIYLPLTSKNKQIGVITVQSFNRHAYKEYHLDIIRNLAVYVVNALENARLYQDMEAEVKLRTVEVIKQKEEIEKSYHDTKLLSEIGREITASLSVEEITGKVYKSVNSLMDATVLAIALHEPENNRLCFPGDIEKGKKLQLSYEDLKDENRSAVWCFKNQKQMVINDFSNEYHNYFAGKVRAKPLRGEAVESLIYLPLSTPNKQLGVITVQSFRKNAYTEYQLNILKTLAIYVVIAVENANLYENLKKRTQETETQKEEIEKSYNNTKLLSEIGRGITTSLSVEEISQNVYKNVNTLMDAAVFGIALFNEKEGRLDFPGVIENGEKMPFGYNLLSDENRPSVLSFTNQTEVVINDFEKDYGMYFPGKVRLAPVSGEYPESIIYIPLSTGNKQLGVITVQSFRKNAYTEYHLSILRNLAIYIVIALENARLYGNMEAEVKLRTAEIEKQNEELEKLSIVASETDNAVIIAGPDGEIQWVNAGFTRITGYTLKTLKEKCGGNLKEISGNPKIKEIVKECIDKRKFVVYELMNKTITGKDIWFQTMLTPIIGKDGNVRNLVAIDSDITKLKQIEMEMRTQNEIISEKNKHITDSINYAKRIQNAILPSDEVIKNILPNSFVLFKPKDIVSGDFYWITEKQGKLFFAVVDCTGHGVPGAFVSIIGHNGLYRAVNEFGLTKPSEILDKLNELVEETFRQNNEMQINDGMDIALCSYDRSSKTLEFAGANNPLYHISSGELAEIKGDKQPIGAFDNRKKFENHTINLKENDSIYVFSDGYADQFGGISGKKFKYNQFKNMLLSLQGTAMSKQHSVLNNTFINWMGDYEQLDDICVIGMKV